MIAVEITRFVKSGGPLTKRIKLDGDGKPLADGSACLMTEGEALRTIISDMHDFAELIAGLASNEAIALGTLRPNLGATVKIRTQAKLRKLNGSAPPDFVARTAENIRFRDRLPAPVLLDFDRKGMPDSVRARLDALGGFWPALTTIIPELANVAYLRRQSTSAGLFRTDTGETFTGSGGEHDYLQIADGTDSERFLKTLHLRCWLAGLGWFMVGAGGQLLDRSIVDRMVGTPERLVFEGPPVLDPPLAQDATSRQPVVHEGDVLDTTEACPPLTIVEQSRLRELKARETQRLAPEAAKAREQFIAVQARNIAKRTGMDMRQARHIAERQTDGILLPDVVLPFDDPELAGSTVADVLADPARFEGETLADPLEGVGYGIGKAKIMRQSEGTPWINSFAHGRTVYKLRYGFTAVKAILEKEPKDGIAQLFINYALQADLTPVEVEELRNITAQRADVGKRPLDAMLKAARKEAANKRIANSREQKFAERQDPRAFIPVPAADAEWLPQILTINEILGKCQTDTPPTRDADRICNKAIAVSIPTLSQLSKEGTNR